MHDLYFYSTDLIFFFLRSDLAWSYMHRVIAADQQMSVSYCPADVSWCPVDVMSATVHAVDVS